MEFINDLVEAYVPAEELEGQGMVEYGLILALISIAAIAVLLLFAEPLINIFQAALDGLTAGAP
jgi:pilus assembly protein Flp/PilA